MYCKNFRCIYNRNTACSIGNIHLDQYGACADCVYPEQNRQNHAAAVANPVTVFPGNGAPVVRSPSDADSSVQPDPDISAILRRIKKIKK